MEQYVTVAEARRRLGVSARTLRRWEAQGILVTVRSPGGHRMFGVDSLTRVAHRRHEGRPRAALYARVSSIKQKRDGNLDRQRDRLVEAATRLGYHVVAVISEQASGINEKRSGLHRLLRMAKNGEIDIVLVEFQDRLAQFGYRYIEEYLSAFGVQISCLDETSSNSSEEELTKDLVTIITLFSARLYGRRSHGFRKKVTDVIQAHHAQSQGGHATSG